MEWFNKIVGEEITKALTESGTYDKLKTAFGDTEYIPHDKDKWIEKHVFNNQRSELKALKDKITKYDEELANRGDLITGDEHKLKLIESERAFKTKLEAMEQQYKQELEVKEKDNLLLNLFTSGGCKKPKYIVKSIDYKDVIVKDGIIQNAKELLEGYQKDVPELFNNFPGSTPPKAGTHDTKTTKEQLVEQYNKTAPGAQKMALMRQIKEIETK